MFQTEWKTRVRWAFWLRVWGAHGPSVGRWVTATLWSVTPLSDDEPALLCPCGGFIYFPLSLTHHRMEWGGGKDSYSRNMLSNAPNPPSHSERKTESSPWPTDPAWPVVVTSLSLPLPSLPLLHSIPARGASSMFLQLTRHDPTSGPLHAPFSLPRECSSPSTCITPSSLCSNVTFLTSLFQFL